MKIRTASGALYEIDDHGICRKYDSDGLHIDSFKVFFKKALPTTVRSLGDVWDYPNGEPEVGKLLYIGGMDSYWISTEVVSIEYELHDKDKNVTDL